MLNAIFVFLFSKRFPSSTLFVSGSCDDLSKSGDVSDAVSSQRPLSTFPFLPHHLYMPEYLVVFASSAYQYSHDYLTLYSDDRYCIITSRYAFVQATVKITC